MIVLTLPDTRRFPLGRILATPAALAMLGENEDERGAALSTILARHAGGDWGDLCPDARQANEDALVAGGRLLSSYTVRGHPVWIITETDRSATTALLPDDY